MFQYLSYKVICVYTVASADRFKSDCFVLSHKNNVSMTKMKADMVFSVMYYLLYLVSLQPNFHTVWGLMPA